MLRYNWISGGKPPTRRQLVASLLANSDLYSCPEREQIINRH